MSPHVVDASLKPLIWIATCREDLRKHLDAKPLKGFGGAGVLEIVEDFDGNAYRAIYTVKLPGVVYALHAFQKKSKKGIRTSPDDIDKVKTRLRMAVEIHAQSQFEAKENTDEKE